MKLKLDLGRALEAGSQRIESLTANLMGAAGAARETLNDASTMVVQGAQELLVGSFEPEPKPTPVHKTVFVIYGRNLKARDAMFEFLESLTLRPTDFSATLGTMRDGAPYIGNIVQRGMKRAHAVVAIFTPDEVARIEESFRLPGEGDAPPRKQARPNVIFEAGMALGINRRRTILVTFGDQQRMFSDVSGIHLHEMDNSRKRREALVDCLESVGCTIKRKNKKNSPLWWTAGRFDEVLAPIGA